MSSVNKVIIIGRLGQDPEVRQFNNGGIVASISVATSERWTDKQTGERKEQTEWHRISLYNRLAEIAQQYLHKGSMVYIEGSLHTRKWQDPQTGQDRYSTEIKASSMQMLSSNQDQGQQAQWQQYAPQQQGQQSYGQPPQQHGQQQRPQGMGSSNYMGDTRPPIEPAVNVSDDDMPF